MSTEYSKCPSCGIVRQTHASRPPKVCVDCKQHHKRKAPRGQWLDEAACRLPGVDPVWFHSEDPHGIDRLRAVSVCEMCPVQPQCLEHAMTTKERYGIWGGLTPNQRTHLAYLRTRQENPNVYPHQH